MNRYSISFALFLAVLAGIVAIALLQPDRIENKVYLAVAQTLGSPAEAATAAFLSRPSDCSASTDRDHDFPYEVWLAFHAANRSGAAPVRLVELEGRYNVVGWEHTVAIAETDGVALPFLPTDKQIVQLSRVGFDSARRRALVCVETVQAPARGSLFYLEESDGKWRVVRDVLVWLT